MESLQQAQTQASPLVCELGSASSLAAGKVWRCYERERREGLLQEDPAQYEAMQALTQLAADLLGWQERADTSPRRESVGMVAGRWLRHWVLSYLESEQRRDEADSGPPMPRGLYLWGGVGRGKTHLVDLFFHCLPMERKLRLHFHRFMELVHESLTVLEGEADPLEKVAADFAQETDLLVLDELLVADITDAMILGELFRHLLAQKVVLVFTSNFPPDELYKDGLQRSRFLPAIEILKQHTRVVELSGDQDYRLGLLEGLEHYLVGDDMDELNARLERQFHRLVAVERHQGRGDIVINGRQIPVVMWADGVLWCRFEQLCATDRSVSDYIKIARIFHTLMLSEVPQLDAEQDDAARRFVLLVDELYERGVKLIVSAAVPPDQLYVGNRLAFEFERALSRLHEMQSSEYWHRPHRS